MKIVKYSALALLIGSGYSFADDCTAPALPELPDGATATMEQMLAGQKSVKAFQAANLEYMKCLEPGIETARAAAAEAVEKKEGVDEAKAAFTSAQDSYNAAVSAEEDLAGRFNNEVRAFKSAHPN